MADKKAVAAKDDSALVGVDFMQDAGAGMEKTDKESFAIPFLRALQKNSPQVDEADAGYVAGAKAGQLFNSVTQELFEGKDGVTFLPCYFQRTFLRWAPRGADGGMKGEYSPEEVAELRASGAVREVEGRLYFPDESGEVNPKKCDHLADTRSHFGILVDDKTGEAQQVLLALTSTQIKKSKRLMSMLNSVKVKGPNGLVTPPTWVNRIKLTTALESNSEGNWYGINVERDGFIQDQSLYDTGKAFYETIKAGEAKVNYAETAPGAGGEASDKF